MKRIIIFLLLILCVLSVFSQEFKSNKQRYIVGYNTTMNESEKNLIIQKNGDKLIAGMPVGPEFEGRISYSGIQKYHDKVGERYDIDGGGLVVFYDDEIFLNAKGDQNVAVTYFLSNYVDSKQEVKDKEAEQAEYNINLKLFGKLTADCVRDKKVVIGMSSNCLVDVLGESISEKVTQTANSISFEFTYHSMIVYTDGRKVTSIIQTLK